MLWPGIEQRKRKMGVLSRGCRMPPKANSSHRYLARCGGAPRCRRPGARMDAFQSGPVSLPKSACLEWSRAGRTAEPNG